MLTNTCVTGGRLPDVVPALVLGVADAHEDARDQHEHRPAKHTAHYSEGTGMEASTFYEPDINGVLNNFRDH